MSDQHIIKVLWIDDEPQKGFMKFAYNQKGIFLDVATCVDDGIAMLQDRDKSYEAIILDANCIIKPGGVAVLDALTYAIVNLYRLRVDIPWFVYTAGGEQWKDVLPYLIPKDTPWLKRQYYDKPADEEIILDDIREAVAQFQTTKIKQKYSEAFHVYDGQDLVELLKDMETNDQFDLDNSVPGKVRLIVDWICKFMSQIKLIPFEFVPSKITEHSKFFGKSEMRDIVPIYLQGLMRFLVEYSNDGNHRFLNTCEDIRAGNARYANRAGMYALLNIFNWLSTLPYSNREKMDSISNNAAVIYMEQKNKRRSGQ